MKQIIFNFLIAGFFTLFATGCKKFLDVAPDNIGTIDYAFRMRSEAEKYLFTCYNNLPYFGNMSWDPGFLSSGEFHFPYPNDRNIDITMYRIFRDEQNVVNPIGNFWDGQNGGKPYFQALRECNIFLENIDNVPDISEYEKRRWVSEVKTLKAYYHFYLFRMYGPIPLIRTNLPVSSSVEDVKVKREHVDTVVNYIVSLIDEAVPNLPDRIANESSELGRVTKQIALSVKAEVLTTAASPLFNGNSAYNNFKNIDGTELFNPNYSVEKWQRAAEACKAAIDTARAQGSRLYYFLPEAGEIMTDSTRLTMNIRAALTDKWNPEILWGASNSVANNVIQRYSQARITSGDPSVVPTPPATNEWIASMLAPPLQIAEMFYSNNGVPIEEDRNYDYAGRLSTKIAGPEHKYYIKENFETAQLNFDREPRFYADLGFDGGIWYGTGLFDDNKTWYITAKKGQFGGRHTASLYSVTGYWPKKLVNYKTDFGSNSGGYNAAPYPWPVIRLSQVYLLYAEALNEAYGPSPEVYQWIDSVRMRAGLKGVIESWNTYSRNPSKPLSQDGLREIIQKERMIELVFEGKSYWDILRWKKGEAWFNATVTGWDTEQETVQNYYRVRQIYTPAFTQKDYLWPLSENTLVVNPNLVQNPMW